VNPADLLGSPFLHSEIDRISGHVKIAKTIAGLRADNETGLYDGLAYASQLPWLQHDSIKNNILFGAPFEKERYDEVIKECALGSDLELFDAGDETGE
jgi:ABC-type multidrug transport system fused ATPase/permease subunit